MRLKLRLKHGMVEALPEDDSLDFEDYEVDDEFRYLRFKKPGEVFTRVDRYSIIRYYFNGDERKKEFLFYPSSFGFNEIRSYMVGDSQYNDGAAERLMKKMHQLVVYGNADWNQNVTEPVKKIAKLTLRAKPINRLKLKAKIIVKNRLKLKAKNETVEN
jgi:hypothetical protein